MDQQMLPRSTSMGALRDDKASTAEIDEIIERIKDQTLGRNSQAGFAESGAQSAIVVSSEEESAMQSDGEDSGIASQNIIGSSKFSSLRSKTPSLINRKQHPVITKSKELHRQSKSTKQIKINPQEQKPKKVQFASEMEFFLHYMWSQKGFQVEDNSDEYTNMRNLQSSQAMRSDPTSQQTAHRNSHLNKSGDPAFYRQQKAEYMNRVPISFNFQIPNTLMIGDGEVKRWYYSNNLGQIKIHNPQRDWMTLVENKLEDQTTPALISFKNPQQRKSMTNLQTKSEDGQESDNRLIKDIMSSHRTIQFIKTVTEQGFPKEVHMLQEILFSADQTPAISAFQASKVKPVSNTAEFHELFECQWSNDSPSIKIYRLRNLLKKQRLHVASSKAQMTAQLKPIRSKHGKPNPSKALLLKLSVPQQLIYLSHEEGHNFVERMPINTSSRNLEVKAIKSDRFQLHEAHPRASLVSSMSNRSKRSIVSTSNQSNRNSPRVQQLAAERQALASVSEEIEREVRAAVVLVRAQFMLHQIRLDQGTFYFQWVSLEEGATRDAAKPIEKRLYLVYVKDLVARDSAEKSVPLPRRPVPYHRDVLTQHFTNLIWAHAELKVKERKHTSICSCQIQIDLQPSVKPFIQEVYARLSAQNPSKFQLKYMEETLMEAFGYLLNISDSIRAHQAIKKKEVERVVESRQKKRLELFLDPENDKCFVTGHTILRDSQKQKLPLMHLVYMPQQEQFLDGLGDTLSQASKERLLFSNKELPPFLRLLLPNVESVAQFQELQRDKEWLDQEVSLSKKVYQLLLKKIIFHAKQSERLEEVQADFQEQMLRMVRGNHGLNRERANSVLQKKQSRGSSVGGKDSDNQSQSRVARKVTKSTRKQDSSRTVSRRASNLEKGGGLEPSESYEYMVLETNKSSARIGTKRGVQQLMGAQAAMEGRPISRQQLSSRQVVVSDMSKESTALDQLIEKVKDHELVNQKVVSRIKDTFEESRLVGQAKGNKVQFSNEKAQILSGAKSQSQIDTVKQRSSIQTISGQVGRISSVKDQLYALNQSQSTEKGLKHKSFTRGKMVSKIVEAPRDSFLSTQDRVEGQRELLNRLQRKGDKTFDRQDLDPQSLENSLKQSIQEPLFQKALPTVDNHTEMRCLLSPEPIIDSQRVTSVLTDVSNPADRIARDQLQQLQPAEITLSSLIKTTGPLPERRLDKIQQKKSQSQKPSNVRKRRKKKGEEDNDIVLKLLEKHVPDYRERQQAMAMGLQQPSESTNQSINAKFEQMQTQESGNSKAGPSEEDVLEVKKRRRALVQTFQQLKQVQTEKNLKMLDKAKMQEDQHNESETARRVTVREINSRNDAQPKGELANFVATRATVTNQTAELVQQNLQNYVQAQSLQNLEIARLTQDPIFGGINQSKILKADQIIRDNRIKEDPHYKAAMRDFARKIKHPQTKAEFALRAEHQKVKECENLVKKMNNVINDHVYLKPAAVASHRDFDLTSRLEGHAKNETTKRKKSKRRGLDADVSHADLKNEAFKAINMIELLKKREDEIGIEEERYNQRKLSNRATFLIDEDSPRRQPLTVSGHFFDPSKSERVPWVFNPEMSTQHSQRLQEVVSGRAAAEKLLEQRTRDLINMEHLTDDLDAQNRNTLGESIRSLNKIDRNINSVSRILGRSKTASKLPTIKSMSRKKKVPQFRNQYGQTVAVGLGKDQVTALNQSQASFVSRAQKHNQSGFKLRDLFQV